MTQSRSCAAPTYRSGLILVAILSAFAASLTGLLLSYYANVPTGPAIILVSGAGYILSMLVGVKGGLIWQLVHRKHLEAFVVASKGVKPLTMSEEDGHNHAEGAEAGEEHEEHAKGVNGHEEQVADPHAWQDLANGELYVANIRDGLIAADPEGKATYEANAAKYLDALAKEEVVVKEAIGKLPPERRRIITSHDAFGYFGAAYGVEIIAPEGVSTETEASAQDVAKIIRQIKAEKIPAVFLENVTDHRLLDQIANETGVKIGGTLYSDALSEPEGPAPTYLDMFHHNIGVLTAALSS